jgi:hypothetical protein
VVAQLGRCGSSVSDMGIFVWVMWLLSKGDVVTQSGGVMNVGSVREMCCLVREM